MTPCTVVLYGKVYTTSALFMHALRHLTTRYADETQDVRFHFILDDRRDRDLAASLLDPARVTVEAQYETCRPDDATRAWPDETVRGWESRYGVPHLRPYLHAERILEERPEAVRWRYLFSHLDYFERVCDRLKPSLFVSGAASVLSSWLAINVFQRRGVPTLIYSPARFGDRCFLAEDAHERLNIGGRFRHLQQEGCTPEQRADAGALIQQYRDHAVKPTEFWMVKRRTKMRLIPRPNRIVKWLHHASATDGRYYDESFRAVATRALKARRTWAYERLLHRRTLRSLPADRPFFFLPLQFEPEMSISTQGRGWTDQLELVRLVSESLPIDRWLYVKEHPMMPMGVRPLSFYRTIQRLPRVALLDQRMDSYSIVPKAEAVITLGSTVGWEALMFRRPVLLAGRAFYEEFSDGVIAWDDVEALPGLLRGMRDRRIDEDALIAFTAGTLSKAPHALLTEPRQFPEAASTVLGEENLDRICRILLERLSPQGEL